MSHKLTSLLLFFFISINIYSQYATTVTLYEHCNYGGRKYYLEVGNHWTYQMKIGNDKLSSLKIPNGLKITLYEHDKFQGRSVTYTSNITCLPSDWNEAASSIVVESTTNPNQNTNDYVVFYNDCYNKGYSQTLRTGTYTGTQLGILKNNISSFTIYGNLQVKVYINNDNLSGYSYTHQTSTGCLSNSQNDKISSLVVEYKPYQSGYPGVNNNPGGNYNNSFATIYTSCNYGGNSLRLAPGSYQGEKLGLMKYDISSIELPSNLRARVFINSEYLGGSSYTLNESVNCLSSTLNNRIGSLVIEDVGTGYNPYNPYENPPAVERVMIYTDINYRGLAVALLPGTYSNMTDMGFENDALSSLTLPPGYRVVLYENENFTGKSYTINQSKTQFTFSGWNDKTSSIAVYRE